jgi:hypothetical protein
MLSCSGSPSEPLPAGEDIGVLKVDYGSPGEDSGSPADVPDVEEPATEEADATSDLATPGETTAPDPGEPSDVPDPGGPPDPGLPPDPGPFVDTDKDGLDDAKEKALGTNPFAPDSDGDGLLDGAEVNQWGTDPLAWDMDGDTLSDGQEVSAGTDPKKADTDGDGADDASELAIGLDPKKPDSDGDGIQDGGEPLAVACGLPGLVMPKFLEMGTLGYRLALPKETVVDGVGLPDPAAGAWALQHTADGAEVAAFAVTFVPAGGTGGGVDGLSTAIMTALGTVCPVSVRSAGYKILGWDGVHELRVMAVMDVACAAGFSPGKLRNAFLAAVVGQPLASIQGLPTDFGAADKALVASWLVQLREQGRIVVVGAAASRKRFDDTTDPTRLVIKDLVNGTALGNYLSLTAPGCDPFAGKTAKADFVWSVDDSPSMNSDKKTVAATAPLFLQMLADSGVDYRLAVTTQTCSDLDSAAQQAGLHADAVDLVLTNEITGKKSHCTAAATGATVNGKLCNGKFFTGASEFQDCVLWDSNGSSKEYTLSMGVLALDRSLPRQDGSATKLRPDATTVLVVMTDEHEQAFETELSWLKNATPTDPVQVAQLAQVTDPYIAWLKKPDVQALTFGLIVMPDLGASEADAGIYRVVSETGGTAGHLPSGNLEATLNEIIGAAIGYSSVFKLKQPPISMTVKVSLAHPKAAAKVVPRSRKDGFEFDPLSNGLVFHGSWVPKTGDEVGVSYQYWVK